MGPGGHGQGTFCGPGDSREQGTARAVRPPCLLGSAGGGPGWTEDFRYMSACGLERNFQT